MIRGVCSAYSAMSKDRAVWKTYTSVGWAIERDENHVRKQTQYWRLVTGNHVCAFFLRLYIGELKLKEVAISEVARVRESNFLEVFGNAECRDF